MVWLAKNGHGQQHDRYDDQQRRESALTPHGECFYFVFPAFHELGRFDFLRSCPLRSGCLLRRVVGLNDLI